MQWSRLRFGQLLKSSGLRTNYTKFSKPLYTQAGQKFRFCSSTVRTARPPTNYGRFFGYAGGFGLLALAGHQGYSYYQFSNAVPVQIIAPIEPPAEEFVHPYHSKPWYWQIYMKIRRLCYLCVLFTPVTLLCIGVQFTDDPDWRQWFLDKLVATLEKSGCSFQKFAQWMSMRPDIVPADICEALGRMCNDTIPHPFEHTQKEIRECFGKEIDEIFEEFDPVAVASGSVAQVHKARLRPEYVSEGGDQDVAVKVRHPNVLMEVYADLDILFSWVDLVTMFSQLSIPFDHSAWKRLLRQQMDFKWEAYNMHKFQTYFKDEKHVRFPKITYELLSESVLVESWMPGKTVSEILSMFGDKYDEIKGEFSEKTKEYAKKIHTQFSAEVLKKKKHLAKIVFDINMKMFVRDNFVHGDLHAGNVIFSENDDTLTVIDTGLVTTIGSDYSNEFGLFLHALCTGNADGVAENLESFCVTKPYNEETFKRELQASVRRFCGPQGGTKAPDGGPVLLGELLGDILNTLQRNGVQLRGDVATNIVTMSVSEGLIRRLDPDFDIVTRSLPYFVRYRAWRKADLNTTVDQEKRAKMNSPFGSADSGNGFKTTRKVAAYT